MPIKSPGRRVEELTKAQLESLVLDIRMILWPTEQPDKPWSPDTLDAIAYSMGISRVDGPEKPKC